MKQHIYSYIVTGANLCWIIALLVLSVNSSVTSSKCSVTVYPTFHDNISCEDSCTSFKCMNKCRKMPFYVLTVKDSSRCRRYCTSLIVDEACFSRCTDSKAICDRACIIEHVDDLCFGTCMTPVHVENPARLQCEEFCVICFDKDACVSKCLSSKNYAYMTLLGWKMRRCLKNPYSYITNKVTTHVIVAIVNMADHYGRTVVESLNYNVNHTQGIGYFIYDVSCMNAQKSILDALLDIRYNAVQIVAVVTFLPFRVNLEIANILLPSGIPLFCFLEMSTQLTSHQDLYKHFVPLNTVESQKPHILLQILQKFNISYVTLLYEDSHYGMSVEHRLGSDFKQNNICIESSLSLTKDNKNILAYFREYVYRQMVIIITEHYANAATFIRFTLTHNVSIPAWFVYVKYYNDSALISPVTLTENIFYLGRQGRFHDNGGFIKYVSDMCFEKSRTEYCMIYAGNILHADTAIKILLHSINKSFLLPLNNTRQIQDDDFFSFILETKVRGISNVVGELLLYFTYRDRNVLRYDDIGAYEGRKENIWFFDTVKNVALESSVCQKNCEPGYYPIYVKDMPCCWICQICDANMFKNISGNTRCHDCPVDTLSNKNKTKCLRFTKTKIEMPHKHRNIIYATSSAGVVLMIFVIVVFIIKKSTPVVKSSNFAMSLIQLTLHLALFLSIILFSITDTILFCILTSTAIGNMLTIIFSVTLAKIHRLLFVFQARSRLSKRSVVVTKRSEATLVLSTLAMQLLLSLCIQLIQPVHYKTVKDISSMAENISCDSTVLFIAQVMFILCLSFLCSIQAFRSRNLPENYNEARYISLAMFSSTLMLVCLILVHISQEFIWRAYFLDACGVALINFFLLFFLYGVKVYIMLFQPHRNNEKVFRETLMNAVKLEVDRQMARVDQEKMQQRAMSESSI